MNSRLLARTTDSAHYRVLRWLLVAIVAIVFAFTSLPLLAQQQTGEAVEVGSVGVRLNQGVQQSLSRLQDQWLLWNSSFLQGRDEQMQGAERDLARTASELGFSRLPDLAAVAMARAVEAARTDDPQRAEKALHSAELFDPHSPALPFARSRVQFAANRYLSGAVSAFAGYVRVLFDPSTRDVAWRNVLTFFVAAVQVTGVLLVAVLMILRGPNLTRDLGTFAGRFLPPVAVALATVILLAAPALLPHGWLWLTVAWSILLWGYCSLSERVVLGLTISSLILLPLVVLFAQASLLRNIGPGIAVVQDIETQALRGSFFRQLNELQRLLPDSVALQHLSADIHQRLGQDDVARPLYSAVVDREPRNAAALNNLGVFHLVRRDYVPAIAYFQKAADEPGGAAAASYNLAASYDALLEFRSATRAREAGRASSPEFAEWSNANEPWVSMWGGLERVDEVRQALREDAAVHLFDWRTLVRPVGLAVLLILLGPAVRWLRMGRISMRRPPVSGELWIERFARIVLPGVVAADSGDGLRAYASLFLFSLLVLALIDPQLEYLSLSMAQEPVDMVVRSLAGVLLVSYFVITALRRWSRA